MDAHVGVYRTPPKKATRIRKLPIRGLVTSTEKERSGSTPPQVKGPYSWWGDLSPYTCSAGG